MDKGNVEYISDNSGQVYDLCLVLDNILEEIERGNKSRTKPKAVRIVLDQIMSVNSRNYDMAIMDLKNG